jgi:hypothetical protein
MSLARALLPGSRWPVFMHRVYVGVPAKVLSNVNPIFRTKFNSRNNENPLSRHLSGKTGEREPLGYGLPVVSQ